MVHQEEAPAVLGQYNNPLGALANNRDVHDLRVEHEADLVHLFFNADAGLCGQAFLMTRGSTAANFWSSGYGITSVFGGCVSAERLVRPDEHANQVETFAHEIGHNLGANHDPDNTGLEPANAIYPYAYGHHNFTPQPNRKSVMSYNEGRQLPFFSTVRLRPDGYTLGVAGERENERAVQQTVHVGVRFSDYLPDPGEPPPPPPGDRPAPPTGVSVVATGSTSVKVTWTDASDNEHGFHVHARLAGGGWRTVAEAPANAESADVDGLQPGGRYDFRVRAWNRSGGRNSGVSTIVLREAEYTDCVPKPVTTLAGGYSVDMCVEYTKDGALEEGEVKDFRLDSKESGILYFFNKDNAEVLVKVLASACDLPGNDHVWVYVAPVTDLAFNLSVVSPNPEDEPWTHQNPRGGDDCDDPERQPGLSVCGARLGGGLGRRRWGDGRGTRRYRLPGCQVRCCRSTAGGVAACAGWSHSGDRSGRGDRLRADARGDAGGWLHREHVRRVRPGWDITGEGRQGLWPGLPAVRSPVLLPAEQCRSPDQGAGRRLQRERPPLGVRGAGDGPCVQSHRGVAEPGGQGMDAQQRSRPDRDREKRQPGVSVQRLT